METRRKGGFKKICILDERLRRPSRDRFLSTDVPIATLLALSSNYPPANPTEVIYPELLGNDVSHKCTFHITYKGKLLFFSV